MQYCKLNQTSKMVIILFFVLLGVHLLMGCRTFREGNNEQLRRSWTNDDLHTMHITLDQTIEFSTGDSLYNFKINPIIGKGPGDKQKQISKYMDPTLSKPNLRVFKPPKEGTYEFTHLTPTLQKQWSSIFPTPVPYSSKQIVIVNKTLPIKETKAPLRDSYQKKQLVQSTTCKKKCKKKKKKKKKKKCIKQCENKKSNNNKSKKK